MNKSKTTKISIVIASALCSILVLPMISPMIELNKAFALDLRSYYIQQYTDTYSQLEQIIKQTSDLQKQISDIQASNTAGNQVKIQQLQQQIDANNNKKQSLIQELDHIQDESRALFQIDSPTQKKLDDIVKLLSDKYMVKKSTSYVGDNPVREIFADYQYKKLLVSFDPDTTINNASGDKSQPILNDMKKISGDIPIQVSYAKIDPVQCTTRTQACSPLVGGTDIEDTVKGFDCTEGYRAVDFQSNQGFIMAGHCATRVSDPVYQPAPGFTGNRQVGSVSQWCSDGAVTCDFAFVKTTVSTSTWIFNDGNNFYVMQDKVPQSNQHNGDLVIVSGKSSGVITGMITASNTSTGQVTVQMVAQGGDSGAPAFKSIDGTNVHMYGMIWGTDHLTNSYYYAEDYIANTFSLTG